MTRRALLAACAASLATAADPAGEAWETVTALAAALGRGSDVEFLSLCERSMPDYDALRANVAALVAAAEIESAIDPVKNTGDAAVREIEADWQLHLVHRNDLQRVTRRRRTVICRLKNRSGKWKVSGFDPVSFFAAPSAGVDLAHEGGPGGLLR